MMEPRTLTTADREAQILALWRGRPAVRRTLEDVAAFHAWLVDYAPWLLRHGVASADDVRAIVDAHTVSPEELRAAAVTGRRRRATTSAAGPKHR